MSTPADVAPYDVNFCFPVRELENDRVKLTPFIPSQHADLFFQGSSPHPELYHYLPFGPFPTTTAYIQQLITNRIQPDPGILLYAIIDKTRTPLSTPGASPSPADFAGTIGYLNTSPERLTVEIGFIFVLPRFQRTHVATNAVGLLMGYALNLPSDTSPGLGLRRVQWQANVHNHPSIKVAERMGMKREALLRWDSVLPETKANTSNGKYIRVGDPKPGTLGRDTVMLAICWDDWIAGGREKVARLMAR